MHVAILGMGALGRVYGVRLARRASCTVTFIVRPGRGAIPLKLTRIDGDGASEELESPTVDTRVPADADVVLVCVRAEQLDRALEETLAERPDVPLVMMTPVLPHSLDAMAEGVRARARIAMPGVVAYLKGDVCRYWLPRVAPTLIDAAKPVPEAVTELAAALALAGFGGHLELGVHETNPATTLSFIPLVMGVDAAGGIDPLLANKELLRCTLGALEEGIALGARIGKTPGWVDVLARFAGPLSLKIGMGIARRQAPEALAYVEEHFGRKLHAQNVAMACAIVTLADEKSMPSGSLRALLGHLERVA